MEWVRRVDRFLLAILLAAVAATLWPASGAFAEALSVTVKVVIAALFFLYGVRLSPEQALAGLKHWRLHLTILACTYLVFPVLGLLIGLLPDTLLHPAVSAGLLYLCLVPSTVQSSINFTSIARGNVAAAIVSASASNLLGVFMTPLLCLVLMGTSGRGVDPRTIGDIAAQLLLPFLVGQLSRRWTAEFVLGHPRLKLLDHTSIVLVVYVAFSSGMREHLWAQVNLSDVLLVTALCLALLGLMLWFTWTLALRLGFNRADAVAIQMCGTKKSLATGLPMAALLFAGQPVGLLVLPLMIYHQAQLLVCGWLAGREARAVTA